MTQRQKESVVMLDEVIIKFEGCENVYLAMEDAVVLKELIENQAKHIKELEENRDKSSVLNILKDFTKKLKDKKGKSFPFTSCVFISDIDNTFNEITDTYEKITEQQNHISQKIDDWKDYIKQLEDKNKALNEENKNLESEHNLMVEQILDKVRYLCGMKDRDDNQVYVITKDELNNLERRLKGEE